MMPHTCWADPLSRRERLALARKLARACGAAYQARLHWVVLAGQNHMIVETVSTSAEMADLHMDVTERAAVTL